jgi:hypothetical protein
VGIFEQNHHARCLEVREKEFLDIFDVTQTCENHAFAHLNVLYKWIDVKHSDGVGWARAINQVQMDTDKYDFLYQVDSHMLFDQDWDVKLLDDYYKGCETVGHDKVIITGPCKVFEINEDQSFHQYPTEEVGGMVKFLPEFASGYFTVPIGMFTPVFEEMQPANHVFAGNTLFPVSWVKEGGNDIEIFFDGEEFKITLDSFNKGYSLFFASRIVSYHFKDVHNYVTKQWVEPVNTMTRYTRNVERSHKKLNKFIDNLPRETLVRFEQETGIDYINRVIGKKAII